MSSGVPGADPLWQEYTEAVRGLAAVPSKLAARLTESVAEQDSALAAARADRDLELRRCAEWRAQARRAIANAEARLVAAKVLIPDGSDQPQVSITDADTLLAEVRSATREFESALSTVQSARRQLRHTTTLDKIMIQKRQKVLLRRLAWSAAGAAVIFIVVFYLMV